MSCSTFDVKGYFLGELDEAGRRRVEQHLQGCAACREELERLQLTAAALRSVPDEEIPQRIAFVSDKVFEPGWWQKLWQSGPRLGFASAALLAMAIVVHTFWQPAVGPAPEPVNEAVVEQMVKQQVDQAVQAAVRRAVAASERRQAARTAKLLAAVEHRFEQERQADLLTVRENFEYLSKSMNVMQLASLYQEEGRRR